jgi:hypothetical protein
MNCIGLFLAMTMHIGLESNYNNIHPHARCTIDEKILGAYYNSEDRISTYVGRAFDLNNGVLEIGLVTGYTANDVVPMIRYKQGKFFVSPAYETTSDKIGVVIGLEFGQ